MYKMIISDLDETLLNSDGSINKLNIKYIKKAIDKGVKFIPNTGRSFKSIEMTLKQLDLYNQKNQYAIVNNGAAIINIENNSEILVKTMEFELVDKIFNLGLINNEIGVHIYTNKMVYVYNISESDKEYMANRNVEYEIINDKEINFLKNEKILKIIFESISIENRNNIKNNVLKEVNPNEVEVTFSSQRYIEFNKNSVDKYTAAIFLAESLGINNSEIIAIGDNSNDYTMIKNAGLGIAVSNSIEEIKKIADYITDKDNNNGAVAEMINKYIIKDKELK